MVDILFGVLGEMLLSLEGLWKVFYCEDLWKMFFFEEDL